MKREEIGDNIIFYWKRLVSEHFIDNEGIDKVIKVVLFAKEPGLELSGGINYYLYFVLICVFSFQFRKLHCKFFNKCLGSLYMFDCTESVLGLAQGEFLTGSSHPEQDPVESVCVS